MDTDESHANLLVNGLFQLPYSASVVIFHSFLENVFQYDKNSLSLISTIDNKLINIFPIILTLKEIQKDLKPFVGLE